MPENRKMKIINFVIGYGIFIIYVLTLCIYTGSFESLQYVYPLVIIGGGVVSLLLPYKFNLKSGISELSHKGMRKFV